MSSDPNQDRKRFRHHRWLAPPFHLKHWKWLRLAIFVLLDVLVLVTAYFAAFYLRFDNLDFGRFGSTFSSTLPVFVVINLLVFSIGGIYRQVWRYANFYSAVLIGICVILGTSLSVLASYFLQLNAPIPRSVPVIFALVAVVLVILQKFSWRSWVSFQSSVGSNDKQRALIYGAGAAGELLARHITASPNFPYQAVGFIDDDRNKVGKVIHGIKIMGTGESLSKIKEKCQAEVVLIAIHSTPGWVTRKIFNRCLEANAKPLMMPDMANAFGTNIIEPRAIDVGDLLRRAPANIDEKKITDFLKDRTVLVTGAGGSIGSEICRQVATKSLKSLVLLDSSEFNLYQIDLALRESFPELEIIPVLGSMTDVELVERVFTQHRPTCVLHAAAYKHVPLVEQNIASAITNNVVGTKLLLEAACKYKAERFVLVSSDKAVRPTNVMGATKRVCEMMVQATQQLSESGQKFCAVRFGNVLGSSGSVIPRFLDQIKSGKAITVTHKEMTRYFMLTSEAVGLVLQSSSMSQGGEIFVLNMGEPVNIYEMARQLIQLSGKAPDRDVAIKITGIRPGEKLYEELILEGSETHTVHEDVFIARPQALKPEEVLGRVESLIVSAISGNSVQAKAKLFELINVTGRIDDNDFSSDAELPH